MKQFVTQFTINGKEVSLFSLQALRAEWHGYYVDKDYNVYSTRRGGIRVLVGSFDYRSRYSRARSKQYMLGGFNTTRANLIIDLDRNADFKAFLAWSKKPQMDRIVSRLDKSIQDVKSKSIVRSDVARVHASNIEEAISSHGYIIARVDNGVLSFAAKPVVHLAKASVLAEIEDLAKSKPGVQYVYLKIEGACQASAIVWK